MLGGGSKWRYNERGCRDLLEWRRGEKWWKRRRRGEEEEEEKGLINGASTAPGTADAYIFDTSTATSSGSVSITAAVDSLLTHTFRNCPQVVWGVQEVRIYDSPLEFDCTHYYRSH